MLTTQFVIGKSLSILQTLWCLFVFFEKRCSSWS